MTARLILAMVPAPVLVALVMFIFYEGVPIPQWFRSIPVAGPVAEALIDGRVDRVARAATKDMIARAEFNKERILRHAAELRAQRAKADSEDLARINADFTASLTQAYAELEAANAELDDLAAAEVDAACRVDPGLLDRLRNE
jgi:hypothetical protein